MHVRRSETSSCTSSARIGVPEPVAEGMIARITPDKCQMDNTSNHCGTSPGWRIVTVRANDVEAQDGRRVYGRAQSALCVKRNWRLETAGLKGQETEGSPVCEVSWTRGGANVLLGRPGRQGEGKTSPPGDREW